MVFVWSGEWMEWKGTSLPQFTYLKSMGTSSSSSMPTHFIWKAKLHVSQHSRSPGRSHNCCVFIEEKDRKREMWLGQ